jgi:hypothetical protein
MTARQFQLCFQGLTETHLQSGLLHHVQYVRIAPGNPWQASLTKVVAFILWLVAVRLLFLGETYVEIEFRATRVGFILVLLSRTHHRSTLLFRLKEEGTRRCALHRWPRRL